MATRDGELFKETLQVSLDGRQIFCLFAGGAVIASLVFVLGVMVGRRVEERAHPERAGRAGDAGDPLAALDQIAATDGTPDSELAFASALRGDHAGDPLGPVDVSLEQRGATRSDAPALSGGAAAADDDQGQADQDADPPDEHVAADDGKAAADKPAAAAPAAHPAAPAAPAAAPAPAAHDGPAEVPADQARFTLQLSSFQSRAEADSFRHQLEKSGYAPYVVEAQVDGKGTWYRIRVGHYRDYDDAIAAKAAFEKKQQIIAYVTRL